MSREFGSYNNGYFHTQMEYAAEDLSCGEDDLTRVWARFFEEFKHVAYTIANSEAGDSGKDQPISETIKRLPALRAALKDVEEYVSLFDEVAKSAIRNAINSSDK